jgi:LPS-assembly lipoprotein
MKLILTLLSLCLATTLSACAGFQPLHATSGAQTVFADMQVDVANGGDEGDRLAGFTIRQRLTDRTRADDNPAYLLSVSPRSSRVGIGLTGQELATRFDGVVTADWRLTKRDDGREVASGRVRSVTTYSADQDPYRLQTTADRATERAARDVADQLLQQVALELTPKTAP